MLYEQLLEDTLEDYVHRYKSMIRRYEVEPADTIRVSNLISARDECKRNLQELETLSVKRPTVDLQQMLEDKYKRDIDDYRDIAVSIEEEANRKIEKTEMQNKEAILRAQEENSHAADPLIALHDELLTHKQELEKYIVKYKIPATDVIINSDISQEDLMVLLRSSIEICEDLSKEEKGPFSKVLELKKFEYASIGLLIALYVVCPFLIFPIAYKLLKSSKSSASTVDRLKIAYSAMYDYDFSKYIPEFDESKVKVEDIEALKREKEQRMEDMASDNPETKLAEECVEIANNALVIDAMIDDAYQRAQEMVNTLKDTLQKELEAIQKRIDEEAAKCQVLGSAVSSSPVLSHKYVLCRKAGILDIEQIIELVHIKFYNTDPGMLNLLKLAFINLLCSVRARMLEVDIYDPAGLGVDVANFITVGGEMQAFVRVITEDFSKLAKDLRKYVSENALRFKDKTIDEYNEEAEKIGKVAISYRLLLVLSDAKTLYADKLLMQTLESCAKVGLLVWVYDSFLPERDNTPPPMIPNSIEFKDTHFREGDMIDVTTEMEFRFANTFETAIREVSPPPLYYESMYAPRVLPREKWWTYNTVKSIELNLGFLDGDPDKGYPCLFDDANVHALMGGASGGGKSALINQALITLLTKYSPKQLELVMVDFKNVEFATYADPKTGLSRLPHTKIIAGTKDGEYAISIFQYLYDEMQRRTEFLAKRNLKKIEEYNEKNPPDPIPRILVIIDEFQVMFTEVEQKAVDKITTLIKLLSKLARFCGCHLWFTSQSMKGTMSKDILDQFSTRMMLRASSDASTEILGSPVAAKMPAKHGYVYSNDSAGEDPTKNKLWKVPFIRTEYIDQYIADINQMAAEQGLGEHRALFYDEGTIYKDDKLMEWYDKHSDVFGSPYTMILGERTAFSTNNAPVNFRFIRGDNEHLLACGGELPDMLNLVMTCYDNIKRSTSESLVIMHCCDMDCYNMLEVDKLVEERFLGVTKPSADPNFIIDKIKTLDDMQQAVGYEDGKPIYVFIIMAEKLACYAQDDYRATTRFQDIIRDVGVHDIHILLFTRMAETIPPKTRNFINHRIAAKCTEKSAFAAVDDQRPQKLPRGDQDGYFAIYKYSDEEYKFKIYQHTFARSIESRSVVM